ncbi:hypothetical protein Patl1_24539 [Pistacia atlantica]|uniref:Uncharacterized protein n=1 Tax=Pistacia atlantica TaxID=434234 RepID=A0ACC0ZXK3_9ROSI|nr:hypothetical protein Patl1_24539 [Pistacia atlantica]
MFSTQHYKQLTIQKKNKEEVSFTQPSIQVSPNLKQISILILPIVTNKFNLSISSVKLKNQEISAIIIVVTSPVSISKSVTTRVFPA